MKQSRPLGERAQSRPAGGFTVQLIQLLLQGPSKAPEAPLATRSGGLVFLFYNMQKIFPCSLSYRGSLHIVYTEGP